MAFLSATLVVRIANSEGGSFFDDQLWILFVLRMIYIYIYMYIYICVYIYIYLSPQNTSNPNFQYSNPNFY